MRLVADENVDQPIVRQLRANGHEVLSIAELDPGVTDLEVLSLANQHRALLITADRDFGKLVIQKRLSSAGVILLRLAGLSATTKAAMVSHVLNEHGPKLPSSFCVIGPTTVRIRRSLS